MATPYCIILTTTGSQDEANLIAEVQVSRRLAACVQVSNINSTYRWQGEVHQDAECLLLIKTMTGLYEKVEAAILENHSYDTPEVIQIPIENGLDRYLGWIDENTLQSDG
jgi:periplasmic divalent cation tolerance protein